MLRIYGGMTIELPVTWEVGIVQAKSMSKQLTADWTRHCAVVGPIQHMDMYSDLYNEGSITLKKNLIK